MVAVIFSALDNARLKFPRYLLKPFFFSALYNAQPKLVLRVLAAPIGEYTQAFYNLKIFAVFLNVCSTNILVLTGLQHQYDIFQTPLSSGYPIPLRWSVIKSVEWGEQWAPQYFDAILLTVIFSALDNAQQNFARYLSKPIFFLCLKVGTNENGSACGRWLSIGI